MTALMSVNILGGVMMFEDNFGWNNVILTLLCLWGFSSYLFGMYMKMKEEEKKYESLETLINNNNDKDDGDERGEYDINCNGQYMRTIRFCYCFY